MYPQQVPSLALDIIPTYNLLTIGLADISFYPSNFVVTNPTYQIFPPNFPPISLAFTKSSINIFNSNDLNLACVGDTANLTPLPDGIWKIQQSVTPISSYFNEKSFLRVERIKQAFGTAFLKTDMINCDAGIGSESMKYLTQIWSYIQGAVAASNQCNMLLAMELYRLADRTLKNFMKDNCNGIPTKTSWY